MTIRKISNSFNTLYQLTQVTDSSDRTSATFSYTINGQIATAVYPNGTKTSYGYDSAGRVINITYTNISTGALIREYAGTYDAAGRLTKVVESLSGDATAYSYDAANNLLSEVRTGARPYSGTYSYYADGQRKTALVIIAGVTTHNGAYSYDNGGRLAQVIDRATNPPITELYTWNNDNTLASSPGPGYTRQYVYSEESQLLSISHSGTLAYQYAYGADGNRRWRKDIANDVWTWYPCGVACGAGELVEETSDLTGGSWSTRAQYLRAGGGCSSLLIRRNSEYHCFDLTGTAGVILDGGGNALSDNLYDNFSVDMYSSGNAVTPYRVPEGKLDVEGMVFSPMCVIQPIRDLALIKGCGAKGATFPKCKRLAWWECKVWGGRLICCIACRTDCYLWCMAKYPGIGTGYEKCVTNCHARYLRCLATGVY